MLPFLKKKEGGASGILVKNRAPDEPQNEASESEGPDAIDSCMEQFLSAVKASDAKAMSDALYDAHEIMHGRMSPEQYKEPKSKHTFEDQNEEAGEE